MSDTIEPTEGCFYACPSRLERFWRWVGFRFHLGEDGPEWPAPAGWMQNKTRFHFDWSDRLRLLLTGRLEVTMTFDMDVPSPDKIQTRMDWYILPPGTDRVMIQPSRRSFITGLIAFAAAPAIVRASSLMPVKAYDSLEGMTWFVEHYRWEVGIVPDDWRYAARVCNIDTSLPGNPNLIGALTTELRRAPPIVEFDKIDTSDPLWAMPT